MMASLVISAILMNPTGLRVTLAEAGLGNIRPILGLTVQPDKWFPHGYTAHHGLRTGFCRLHWSIDGQTPAGFKKVRVTVSATNQNFAVRVIGWNPLGTPDFDPAYELIATFTNTSPSLQGGRIGFGNWGQGGFGAFNAINGIPIGNGGFFDNIVAKSPADGPMVFSENFETAALANQLPAGWTNPYTGVATLEGTWVVNVDGRSRNWPIRRSHHWAPPRSESKRRWRHFAPDQVSRNYFLQVGFNASTMMVWDWA
jgi:hypothetical protein